MQAPRRPPRREPPEPVEADAVTVISVGTVLWAIGLAVTLLLHDRLERTGHEDWVWITVAGLGLGLLGIRIVRRRRDMLRRSGQPDPSGDDRAPNPL